MGHIEFSWDPRKAAVNARKHRVTFEEAQSAFLDENARIIDDPDHSQQEQRFLLLGYSAAARCLVVSHCLRKEGGVIRLISARKATAGEETAYWSYQ